MTDEGSEGPPHDPMATGLPMGAAAPVGDGVANVVGASPSDRPPERGELHIVERRSWKTWQLVLAVIIAAVLGMAFNGASGSATTSAGSSGSGSGSYKLPAPSGSATTTAPASGKLGATTTTAAGGATTTTAAGAVATTVAGGATTTTAAGGTTAATGPATVLVPATQLTGNWTSPAFNIAGGTWNIGWAFQCASTASTPTFEVFVVDNGASPGATPAVTSAVTQGQSVTPQASTGSQQIVVRSPAGCRWVVKVTGFSG